MVKSVSRDFTMQMESHFGDRVVRCFRDRPASVYAMLAEAVRRNPDGEALVCGEARLNWTQLHEVALRVAGGLAARGVIRGDRIALLLGNRNEFVIAMLAAVAIGAIVVPISTREQTPGLLYLLDHSGATVVIHDGDLGQRLPLEPRTPLLLHRIAADPYPGSEDFSALLRSAPLTAAVEATEEDVVAILYTSGTTGRPKGAMLTHFNIVHSALHYELAMGLDAQDRAAVVVPLSHVTGLVALMMAMMRCAGTLLVVPFFRAADFIRLAERERMTLSIMVPAMYNLCLLQEDFAQHDLSTWRIGGYGGAPMPIASIKALAERFPKLALINAYGSTETTSPSTMTLPGDATLRGDSVGRAVACGEILIMDEAGHEVPCGEAGEIWLRGPMVVKGYWDYPAATAENFTAGFWHSGDIGSINQDGYLSVFDRRKDMLNRGGYKVYSVEVENVLIEHPAVIEAAVVGKPCPILGERVHVFVTVTDPGVSGRELAAFCAERLSDYKVPESFTIGTDALPRNPNGKLLKREMREQLARAIP